MSELNKVVKDGKVAVLYAPVYDHGWYTRCSDVEQLLYDPTVVSWVLAGKPESMRPSIEVYVEIKYHDDGLSHNLRQLEVSWLPIGTFFRVDDSDGWEAVYVYNASDYHVA
jgi:hypothetical protein